MKKIQLLLAFVLALPASAYASLEIYGVPGPDLSNNIQAQHFLLQVQNNDSESGCVAWNATTQVTITGSTACTKGDPGGPYTGADEKSQTTTRTVGSVNIANGADLRLVFDINENGGADLAIDLTALRLIIQDPTTGNVIFTADLKTPDCFVTGVANMTSPCHFTTSVTGNGKTDAVLRLTATEATAFDTAVAANALVTGNQLASLRIGLLANLNNTSDGFEGFYVGNRAFAAPEPRTILLFAFAVACMLFARRRCASTGSGSLSAGRMLRPACQEP
ncbi:MAG: hypothetical protein C5B46_05220 [Proteobacteria bacterium]|nr:MAG: hypothetical protein C5B46_05220 [Pseudomonadota bacterium]